MSPAPDHPEMLLTELLSLPADQRLQHLRADGIGDVETRLLDLGELVAQLASHDLDRAEAANAMYEHLATDAASTAAQARSAWSRARMHANAGRFEAALELSRDAISIAQDHAHPIEAARARLAAMQPLGEMGRLDDAITEGNAAAIELIRLGESRLGGLASINLGIVTNRADRPAEALEHFDRAAAALQTHPEWLGHLAINRGEALLVLGRLTDAEAAYRDALERLDDVDHAWLIALAEGNLAELAMRQGRLHEALYHFERARRRFETQEAAAQSARLVAEQAEAKVMLGLTAEALADFDDALTTLDEQRQIADAARTRVQRARILLRAGRDADAEATLDTATQAFETLQHPTWLARVDLLRAEARLRAGDVETATRLADDAATTLHDRPLDVALAAVVGARCAIARGDLDDATDRLDAGLAEADRLGIAPLVAELRGVRADVRRRRNDITGAIDDYTVAVDQIERIRGTLQADRFRSSFLSTYLEFYEALVSLLLDEAASDSIARAFAIAERARSRSLLDLVRRAIDYALDVDDDPDVEARSLRDEMSRLRNEINGLYSQLDDQAEDGTRRIAPNWSVAVLERERRLERIESRLSSTQGLAGLYAPTATLEDTAAGLDHDTAMLVYYLAGDELLAFVIRAGRTRVFRHLATAADVRSCAQRIHFQIERRLRPGELKPWKEARLLADIQTELRHANDLLHRPLTDALDGIARLVIVPHGPLHLIPLHALYDGERYLLERHEVAYAPSASMVTPTNAPADRPDRRRALVVGRADDAAPEITKEAIAVAADLDVGPDRLLLGDAATVEAVSVAGRDADIIHLACHGRFSSRAPMDSGLRLADRWLTARDIYALRWDADLVVLSGCETGRSLVAGGDELVGLLRGFLVAGVRTLLVSLWRVNDACTRRVMTSFYETWTSNRTCGPDAALRHAQRTILETQPHPAFWAPFILVGRS